MTKHISIQPTHDGRETGPRYHVTTRLDDRTIEFEKPIGDPFVRQDVHVGVRDLIRAVLRRRLTVTVIVGGDRGIVDDVMDLDADDLGRNCTRRDEFNAEIANSLAFHAGVSEILDGSGDRDV